jgi:hypothetical protein
MRKVRCTRGKIGPFNPAIPIAGDRLRLHQHGSTQTVDLVESGIVISAGLFELSNDATSIAECGGVIGQQCKVRRDFGASRVYIGIDAVSHEQEIWFVRLHARRRRAGNGLGLLSVVANRSSD